MILYAENAYKRTEKLQMEFGNLRLFRNLLAAQSRQEPGVRIPSPLPASHPPTTRTVKLWNRRADEKRLPLSQTPNVHSPARAPQRLQAGPNPGGITSSLSFPGGALLP